MVYFRISVIILLSVTIAIIGCKSQNLEDILPHKKVLVRINDTEITVEEFQNTIKRLLSDSDTTSWQDNSMEDIELKKNILSQMIEEKLILDEARKKGITASDAEVQKEIYGMGKDLQNNDFIKTVTTRYGSQKKWEEEIQRKVSIRKTMDMMVFSKVAVQENEVSAYYNEHKNEFKALEKVKARMIILPTEDEADKTLKRLRRGEDFTKVAKEVSADKNISDAGEFNYYSRGELPREFEDVIFNIPLSRASDVVKTSYGYNIFRVDEKTAARNLAFQESKNLIIEKLKREKGEKAFNEWIKRLKENAKIEIREELL